MQIVRKILSLLLAILMCMSCVCLSVNAATFDDINQAGVFVKQQTNYTCTLASAVMLVRRTAMAAGNGDWSSITESTMRGTAWLEGSGLYYNFTYAGVSIGHSTISSNNKSTFINLLNTYPQGVVAYNQGNGNQWHAILLTDYDASTDTFYCSDPANGTASGRIPLSNSSIVGNGQDGKINNLNEYWYVKSPSISLISNEPTTVIYPVDGGVYKIASGVGNNMYLDFACTNTNIQIYENCDNHRDPAFVISQYYKLTHVGDGWYSIINIGNGMAMDVENWDASSGTNISQYPYHGDVNQLFRFYDAGNGYCYIKSKLGTYVDVQNGDNVNNTNVWAYSFNGSNAQKWKLESHSHSYTAQITTAATCTKSGVRTYTCYCCYSYTEPIPKTAHSYSSVVTTQPTCTTNGVKTFSCSCGASYTEAISAKGHTNDWGDNKCDTCGTVLIPESTTILYPDNNQIVKIAPSFVNGMYLNYDLETNNVQIYENLDENSNDDLVKSQYFEFIHVGDGWYIISNVGNGKVLDVEGGSSATKTNISLHDLNNTDSQLFRFYDTGDGYCYIKSKLGCYLDVAHGQTTNGANVWAHAFNGNAAEKWKLINHSHSYISEVITHATHLTEGVMTYTCICGDSYTEAIVKTEQHDYKPVVTAPTCEEQGYTTYTCECGDSYVADYVKENGHSYTSEITTPATHLTEGVMTYTCACSDSYTEVIAKTPGHTYEAVVTAPTCTEKGYTTYTCECGDSYVADYVKENGHSYTSEITTPATHLKEGVITYTCSCGDTYKEAIAKTPEHTYSSVVIAPTCIEQGFTVYTCECGDSYVDDYIDALEHKDADGDTFCDNCYEFVENEDSATNKCSHMCHKSGFIGFIWKIINFFCKLFGINPVCECGRSHY